MTEELPTTTRTETIWGIRMTEPVTGQELYRDVWVDSTRSARPSRPFVSADEAASQLIVYSARYKPTVVERKRVITEGPWTPVVTGDSK